MSVLHVPVSLGEVIDKITILRLKAHYIRAPEKRANIARELSLLEEAAAAYLPQVTELTVALQTVNARLWQVEDEIRNHEARGDFGPEFIALARAVYYQNDERAALKRAINEALGSDLVEEKSYHDYAPSEEA